MDSVQLEKARLARDPRFDGKFFIGVKTTGIYCRPICKVKMPLAKNITLYHSAAAAAEAGFRPCLRCRPEAAPGTPAWMGTSTTVKRALRLVSEGALDKGGVNALSDRLGVTSRHLSRLFDEHIGASPNAVAQTRRLHLAKKLLDETDLSMIDVAMSAGYQSVRRFNDHFKSVYKRVPSEVRKVAGQKKINKLSFFSQALDDESGFQLKLAYRPPYDFAGVLNFLRVRAIPDVEFVSEDTYTRTISIGGESGSLSVRNNEAENCLSIHLILREANLLVSALEKIKHLFDLNADPYKISQDFDGDSILSDLVVQNPGQRVPGAWEPFEIAVRAIVGQQVSVVGATTVMGRIAKTYGQQTPWGLRFPTPKELTCLDVTQMSMPRKRAAAIKEMSRLVDRGELSFDAAIEIDSLITQLVAIKGIGPWTAQYIAMRSLGDPNAFLHGDLVLLKVVKQKFGIDSDKALLERSLAWQPWRAYAGMHLWRQAATL
ncbi:MAG: DNA-3-methyladenine glycosylase 2 family protein [Pseudomonadales bacterium]|nr:DNA-3-methyladenine glycosylase 2 family protein [Pseudomonadales bacterium]